MLSMNKLLILAAVIAVVWFGFRWWQRQQLAKREAPPRRAAQQRGRAGNVEDMRACPTCGTYVTAGSGPCERVDCPRHLAA